MTSYSIWPADVYRVSSAAASERDQLHDSLTSIVALIATAGEAARPSAAISGAISDYAGVYEKAVDETLARIASVLYNGDQAVAAYVAGDQQMAAQYGQASVVFAGPPLPLPPALAHGVDPAAPLLVSGG